MNERDIFKILEKWVVYVMYLLLIVVGINSCHSCNSNKENTRMRKEIIRLEAKLDSTNAFLESFSKVAATKDDIISDNEEQMARFLFWEREADKPQYKDYTPKDYENLIKEK